MTENEWRSILNISPWDWDTRSVYSDWLLDQGLEDQSFLQRWIVKNKKSPYYSHPKSWFWYKAGIRYPDGIIYYNIPDFIWEIMDCEDASHYFKRFKSRHRAEMALLEALKIVGFDNV